jgi:hypothetical protein
MVRCALTNDPILALGLKMHHKEIEFSVEPAAERDDVWIWRFTIGGEVRAGKTVAKLKLLATVAFERGGRRTDLAMWNTWRARLKPLEVEREFRGRSQARKRPW